MSDKLTWWFQHLMYAHTYAYMQAFLLPRFPVSPFSDLTGVPNYFDVSCQNSVKTTLQYYPYHSLYLFSYLLSFPLFISLLSLVLTHTNSTHRAYKHVLCLLSRCNDSITAQHLPLTSKPPSDTSTSQSWHLLPKHGNFPLTQKAGFTRPMYERS